MIKKVLLMSHILPPAVDGGSKIIYKIGLELKKRGYEVTGLTSNCLSSDDFVAEGRRLDINQNDRFLIYRLEVFTKLRRWFKGLGLLWSEGNVWSKGPVFRLTEFWAVAEKLKNQKIDVIIAGPMPTTILIYAKMLSKLLSAKLVLVPCFHEADDDFRKRVFKKILRSADLVGTLTEHEQNYLEAEVGLKRSVVLGGAVERDFLLKECRVKFPKKRNILFLGNFSAHKRVELLIDAFEIMEKKDKDLTLTIAGQKTLYFPKIEERLKRLPAKIRKKVKLVDSGYNCKILSNLIDHCSVLALPSVNESFGIVLAEAWARGKGVVATDIKPMAEIIKKSGGGLLFQKDDSLDLAKKLVYILAENRSKKMGLRGMKAVKSCYTWEKIGDKVCSELEKL